MPLPESSLRLAIASAVVDNLALDEILDRLWSEDRSNVTAIYDAVIAQRLDLAPVAFRYKEIERRSHRKPLVRLGRIGLTITEIASRHFIRRSTLVALMEHHGFLELAPYGGTQSRRLVTEAAFHGEFGHNVHPENRIGHLEGFNRSCVFPVFYPEKIGSILWCLDLRGIKEEAEAQGGKRKKLAWLLENHPYLPNEEVADIAGCSVSGVKQGRRRSVSSITYEDTFSVPMPVPLQ